MTAHAQCQASLVVGETSWPSVSTLLFLLLWLFWPSLIHCACALFRPWPAYAQCQLTLAVEAACKLFVSIMRSNIAKPFRMVHVAHVQGNWCQMWLLGKRLLILRRLVRNRWEYGLADGLWPTWMRGLGCSTTARRTATRPLFPIKSFFRLAGSITTGRVITMLASLKVFRLNALPA